VTRIPGTFLGCNCVDVGRSLHCAGLSVGMALKGLRLLVFTCVDGYSLPLDSLLNGIEAFAFQRPDMICGP